MNNKHYEGLTLQDIIDGKLSCLPQIVSQNGLDHEPLEEVLICESISGGARYINNMPSELTLSRVLADGTEYKAIYRQV